MGNWAINSLAFEPVQDDEDGISLFREDFVTREYLASVNKHPMGVRVSRVRAKECTSLHVSLKPSPREDQPPGHLVIPEMPFMNKKSPQGKLRRQEIQRLALMLARIASNNEIYTPPGLPDPAARTRN